MTLMSKKLTRQYSGGPIQFVEDWEKTSIKYCKISAKIKQEFGDDTKRALFLTSFYVKDYTSTILESATDYTETFDELLTFLRRRLCREDNMSSSEATANAHIIHSIDNGTIPNPVYEKDARAVRTMLSAAYNAGIRNNSQSLRVPEPIWRLATEPQRDIFRNLQQVVMANRRTSSSNTTSQRISSNPTNSRQPR